MTGIESSKWLKNIESDQNANGIERIWLTIRNELRRKWFVSQSVAPTIKIGEYNSYTGKFEPIRGSQAIQYSTVSLGTNSLTCPSGHRYIVKYASILNSTTGTGVTLSGSINGSAITLLTYAATVTGVNMVTIGMPFTIDAVAGFFPAIMNPIELNPGDSLTMTSDGFVALDAMQYVWVYEDVVL